MWMMIGRGSLDVLWISGLSILGAGLWVQALELKIGLVDPGRGHGELYILCAADECAHDSPARQN